MNILQVELELLFSNQKRIIEHTKFTYSRLGKAFEKQTEAIEDQGQKQTDIIKTLKSIHGKCDDHDDKLLIKKIDKLATEIMVKIISISK